jgi:hypothetical protein
MDFTLADHVAIVCSDEEYLGGLVSSNGQLAALNQPLNEDLNVGIDYTCGRVDGFELSWETS